MKNIKVKYWDVFKPGMFPLVIYREDACDYLYSKKKVITSSVFVSDMLLRELVISGIIYRIHELFPIENVGRVHLCFTELVQSHIQ